MPASSRVQLGNALFEQVCYLPAVTPPATITSGVITSQNVAVPGAAIGDFVSWNILNALANGISVANGYVSAPGVCTFAWTAEGSTVSGAPAVPFLVCLLRPENASMGLSFLPTNVT